MTASTPERPYLIVNADDYGYFACVSKGILKSATHGVVTATGVFANSIHFGEHAAWLRECEALDVGVHLNLTYGTPLTSDFQNMLARSSGRFLGKFAMAKAMLSGHINVDAVKREWRAQIERCLAHGLKLRFLNSHEHIHVLPSLFPVARALADEYDIRHVRFPISQLAKSSSAGSFFRGAVLKALETVNRRHMDTPTPHFLGLEASGKLNMQYLQAAVPRLRAGQVYELMCHPGDFDPEEVSEPRLLRYHDWQGELRTLTSPALRELLDRHGIRLIGYRHLEVRGNRLVARHETNRQLAT
ncbi:MAG TPA: ChbG/HpnK family deacetylase [Gemmatimonadaceae bacterium]|nr:ChbG/HpnK family deacetylase [Gemmatimonadaceae bacterium]